MSDHPSAIWVLGDVFYSISNLGARLAMIDKIAPRIVTEDELLREWSAIKNKVNELYKRRNILAHGMVWGNDAPSSLGYSMFGKKEHMEYLQVQQCAVSFKNYADRIERLAIAMNKHLAER
ncbi:hypothetical protein [Rhizorhabdus argentea]|uniref:hypothetical protein n=1 Tax=Rhizorhabdus argentea TaxID=1387174 RepID=UPI0030EB27EF